MQRQRPPFPPRKESDSNPRPVPTAAVRGMRQATPLLARRGAVLRGRRRVRTYLAPSRGHPPTKPTQFPSDSTTDDSDEEEAAESRGSHESMDSADELGSGSDSENLGSDGSHSNSPYSPPASEGEAPGEKIIVTRRPAKKFADVVEPDETDDTSTEPEELTEKSQAEAAKTVAILKKELRIPDKGSEKDKKMKKLNYEGPSASKGAVKAQLGTIPIEKPDAGPAQEPVAKRLKKSE